MTDKLPLLIGYALLLLASAAAPWGLRRVQGAGGTGVFPLLPAQWLRPAWLTLGGLAVVGVAQSLWSAQSVVTAAVVAAVFPWTGGATARRQLCLVVAGTCMLLIWWVSLEEASWLQVVCAAALAVACGWIAREAPDTPMSPAQERALAWGCAAAGAVLMLLQPLEVWSHRGLAWHHWGAYLGPAELVAAGVVPFVDIPLQYGLGPTLLLVPAGRGGGFETMRWVVFGTNAIGLLAVASACLAAVRPLASRRLSVLATLGGLSASLFWIAFPSIVSTPMVTPSTFGLRFLPSFLLLWWLLAAPQRRGLGVLAWALCVLWSVESAFYGVAIYGAHRLFDAMPGAFSLRRLLLTAVRLAGELAGLIAAAVMLFALVYGTVPDAALFTFYARNPPGPLPMSWSGPVVWLTLVLAVALYAMWHARDGDALRRVYLCAIATLAFGSYLLGRSHANNVLNLMPGIAMLLCASAAALGTHQAGVTARLLVSCLVFMVPFFGFGAWRAPALAPDGAYQERMAFVGGPYTDIEPALAIIRRLGGEGVDVLHIGDPNMTFNGAQRVWSGLHPLTNHFHTASPLRREFVRNVATRLNRPGWLVVHKDLARTTLARDIASAYEQTATFTTGSYVALRLVPRTMSPNSPATADSPSPARQ